MHLFIRYSCSSDTDTGCLIGEVYDIGVYLSPIPEDGVTACCCRLSAGWTWDKEKQQSAPLATFSSVSPPTIDQFWVITLLLFPLWLLGRWSWCSACACSASSGPVCWYVSWCFALGSMAGLLVTLSWSKSSHFLVNESPLQEDEWTGLSWIACGAWGLSSMVGRACSLSSSQSKYVILASSHNWLVSSNS